MPLRLGPLAPGIAFITGGARGLGNAIAVSFAKEGSKGVAIIDIQDKQTMDEGRKNVEEYGTPCITIRADVTKEDEVEAAVAEAVHKFGRIDYAANFAGIAGQAFKVADGSLAEFQKVQDVNATGVFLCTKHQLRQMMKQSSIEVESGRVPQLGSIINCASVNSLLSIAGSVSYTTSKHASLGITKTAALEARAHNIRVNAVSPGFLPTKLLARHIEEPSGAGQAMWKAMEARQGRSAQFEEIGDVVVLMSTPRMSLVNGQNLFVDGGFTINEGLS